MSEHCTNPECLCQGVAPKPYNYLSKRDMAIKYRTVLSKMEAARDELESLEQGGFGNRLHFALAELDEAIGNVQASQRDAAEEYGFTPALGIGPGDWKGTK